MSNLKFNQLLILSNTLKSAGQFSFQANLNLITSVDNTVGKSTLVKVLFWSLGCEPALDAKWKSFDCKTILDFSINGKDYRIYRDKTSITFFDIINKQTTNFEKVTGEFSKIFAGLVNFNFKIPNRNTEELETPPPAYYFLPFYIDQRRSWNELWNGFENLLQYANFKTDLIKYDVGLISDRYFQVQEELYHKKKSADIVRSQILNIDTTFTVLKDYLPQKFFSIDQKVVDQITEQIEKELVELANEQEDIYNKLTQLETEKTQINYQLNIAIKLVQEYEKDYVFAVENIPEDTLECPLCGQIHENSLINRASILSDKVNAEKQYNDITKSLDVLDKKILIEKGRLQKVRIRIDEINKKYVKFGNESVSYSDAVNGMAEASLRLKVTEKKKQLLLEEDKVKSDIGNLEKEKKQLQSKEDKEAINANFIDTFKRYLRLLNISSINLSEINSPLDYNKVAKEGGAAENTRTSFAYYLAIYEMICRVGNQVIAPFVIDTPNQQEQSESNYDKIVETLLTSIPNDNQIFLCAMKNSHLKPFEDRAKIFELDDKKILTHNLYEEVRQIFINNMLI